MTIIPDRRSVLVTGAARAWHCCLAARQRRRRRGPCACGRSPRQGARIPVGSGARQAQGCIVCLERLGMARLELFRRDGLRQTGPAARADERGAEGIRLGRARRGVVAAGRRQGTERHAAAGHPGGERQRRRPAFVGALLARGVRHAGRDRRVGLPLRGPSSHPVGRGARQSHRFGHAVVVLGDSQPRQIGAAHRPQHAARTKKVWRGG